MASLLTLPAEIRRQILELLLLPTEGKLDLFDLECFGRSMDDLGRAKGQLHSYSEQDRNQPAMVIRDVNPHHYRLYASLTWPRYRAVYDLSPGGHWPSRSYTTYECLNRQSIGRNMGIMLVNRRLHEEAAQLLYGSVVFDFDTHYQAIRPFLSDLTPYARSCIKAIRVVKQYTTMGTTHYLPAWRDAMTYLACGKNSVALHTLHLGVTIARLNAGEDAGVECYLPTDIDTLRLQRGMGWISEVMQLAPLRSAHIFAVPELRPVICKTPEDRHDLIRLSMSAESVLGPFLQERLTAASNGPT